jgi:hypothetical protein
MIESPLQIIREKIIDNVKNIFDRLSSPIFWLKAIFKNIMKG